MVNNMTKPQLIKTIISSVLQWVLIIAMIIVAVGSFGTRIPALAKLGFNFFAVTSGSMEPTIPTGSLIMVGKYRLEDLKKGDIVTYQISGADSKEHAVVTHRLFEVKKDEQKQQTDKGEQVTITYTYRTKGDANSEPDQYTINAGNIIGLYKWHVPKLGYVTAFAQTPTGFISLVIIPAAIVILWEIASLVLYFKKYFEQKSKSEIEQLKAELAEAKAEKPKKTNKKKKTDEV